MAFLTVSELYTHLYQEVIDEISRNDATKADTAIDAATEEAKGYLTSYDTDAIFNATGDGRNPILLLYVKDIAVWHFINLANPNVDMQLRLERYEKAVKWLEKVQAGISNPSLPLPAAPSDGTPLENFMKWGSEPPRNNYF